MTDKLAILHIGLPKTGTTTLQTCLERFETRDPATGLWYPRHLRPFNAHYPLSRAVRNDEGAAVFADMASHLAGAPAGTTAVLSDELLGLAPPEAVIAALPRAALQAAGWRLKVLVYVRPHIPMLLSGYQESAKLGQVRGDLSHWVRGDGAGRVRVAALLAAWRAGLGPDLLVRAFAPDRLAGGDVVADFVAVLAAEGVTLPMPETPVARSNESISAHEVAILLHLGARFAGRLPPAAQLRPLVQRLLPQLRRAFPHPHVPLALGAEDAAAARAALAEDAAEADRLVFGEEPVLAEALTSYRSAAETTPVALEAYYAPEQVREIEARAADMLGVAAR